MSAETARELMRQIVVALDACEPAVMARSLAYRALRDGYPVECFAHVMDAADGLRAAMPDLHATQAEIMEVVSMQLRAMATGDVEMIDSGSRPSAH